MRILIVDDDPLILKALNRTFRMQRPRWSAEVVDSGEEATRRLDATPFDLVLTDMQMPGMDGSQVLRHARRVQPSAVRVVLSGHAPLRRILEAEGDYHRFLVKPVDPNDLVAIIEGFVLDPQEEGATLARGLVAGLDHIPSLPSNLAELRRLLRKEEPDAQAVAAVVLKDIGIASKLLKLVNSAYMPFRRSITDLRQAIDFLGMELIKEMVMDRGVMVSALDESPEGMSLHSLWAHSRQVAMVARELILQETGDAHAAGEAYSVGLLHDIGRVVLATNPACAYRSILEEAHDPWEKLTLLERSRLGTDHVQVGAQLLGLWGLPEPFGSALREQHGTDLRQHTSLVSLALHVAHFQPGSGGAPERFVEGSFLEGDPLTFVDSAQALWQGALARWRAG